jgi:NitT/TauT family transport system ATP-binding protein
MNLNVDTSTDALNDQILIEGVGKQYKTKTGYLNALDNIDLSIKRTKFVTLFGPSGCGKSTLLRIIAGLDQQTSGKISLFGEPPATATKRKNISWIPQTSALLPWMTIGQNVQLSNFVNRKADRNADSERISEDTIKVLSEMGLKDFIDAKPDELSGGMRQRASIARGLVQGAPLMLMDEPFSALDDLTRESLRWRLLELWKKYEKTIVFVTHSAYEAVLMSDTVVVMSPRPGRITAIVDINLPRPRTPEVCDHPDLLLKVREVKQALELSYHEE